MLLCFFVAKTTTSILETEKNSLTYCVVDHTQSSTSVPSYFLPVPLEVTPYFFASIFRLCFPHTNTRPRRNHCLPLLARRLVLVVCVHRRHLPQNRRATLADRRTGALQTHPRLFAVLGSAACEVHGHFESRLAPTRVIIAIIVTELIFSYCKTNTAICESGIGNFCFAAFFSKHAENI